MPVLDWFGMRELLEHARYDERPLDYCRTCDEFYWLDDAAEHDGHRKTIVPFVEDRSK